MKSDSTMIHRKQTQIFKNDIVQKGGYHLGKCRYWLSSLESILQLSFPVIFERNHIVHYKNFIYVSTLISIYTGKQLLICREIITISKV